jgi:hypothetical protein
MICIKFEGEFTIIKELASDLKKKGLLETCMRATHRQAKESAQHRKWTLRRPPNKLWRDKPAPTAERVSTKS